MAEKLEDVGYWLPSEFLTDEDILTDNKENINKLRLAGSNSASLHCFTFKFPYDYGSSLVSSPVESSAETESDEEDSLLHELTRQLTISGTTQKVATTTASHNHEKGMVLSTSPQSTLTQVGSWSGRSTISSSGSPNGPSQVSSPPTTPLSSKNDAWDLIYQAAGQVARLRVNGGDGSTTAPGLKGPQKWLMTPQRTETSTGSNFHLGQVRGDEMLKQAGRGMWSREVKTRWSYEQEVLQPKAGRLEAGTGGWNVNSRGFNPPSCAWPNPLIQQRNQLQPGNLGFREGIYFSDENVYGFGFGSTAGGISGGCGGGLKKERNGTGVFLPRRYGNVNSPTNMSDSRKKPGSLQLDPLASSLFSAGSSPAQLMHPTRVVPNLNKMGSSSFVAQPQPQRSRVNLGSVTDYETLIARRNAILTGQQRRSLGTEASSMSHEICLPQEWTY